MWRQTPYDQNNKYLEHTKLLKKNNFLIISKMVGEEKKNKILFLINYFESLFE